MARKGYDTEKDMTLSESVVSVENGDEIVIGLYKYGDTGEVKLGMKRRYTNRMGEERFASIGRMSIADLSALAPAFKHYIEQLKLVPRAVPVQKTQPIQAPQIAQVPQFVPQQQTQAWAPAGVPRFAPIKFQ